MKSILTFVSLLVVCVVINAQEREGTDDSDSDRQSVQQFQRPTILDQNPIRKLVGGFRDQVRKGSSRVIERFTTLIADVRKRTELLDQNIKDQANRLKPQVLDARKRLSALEEQKKQLTEKIKVVNNEFEQNKNEYRSALKEQKKIIDNQIRSDVKDPNVSTELKKESEKLDEKINSVGTIVLAPEPRGLGDGYGRHL